MRILASAAILAALTQAPSYAQTTNEIDRFSAGLRLGILATGQISEGESTTSVGTDPIQWFSTTTESEANRFLWGGTVQVRPTSKIGVNVDFLRRGFDFVNTDVSESQEDEDATILFERSDVYTTKGSYWEIPLTGRYYFARVEDGPELFLSGGVALRRVTGASTILETTTREDLEALEDDETFTPVEEEIDALVANRSTWGAVAGIGLRNTDDFGIHLELEARYTQWFEKSVEVGLANSAGNQIDVMLGLTF